MRINGVTMFYYSLSPFLHKNSNQNTEIVTKKIPIDSNI